MEIKIHCKKLLRNSANTLAGCVYPQQDYKFDLDLLENAVNSKHVNILRTSFDVCIYVHNIQNQYFFHEQKFTIKRDLRSDRI